ncbi:hypothetical protein Fisuc_2417 [Fibrobacter succinogenes subsp. succinogenes S85]|uniref:Transposase/invertase (TIGR01784 family) n=2 Tax=Fibrobacter succinogenes TaxID=833 RepID=A0ABN3YWT9_FIBSS|nr:hypothetical protein Fisuc_2417 [Fibrobacter succinogenes subsp. succinogenes S85]
MNQNMDCSQHYKMLKDMEKDPKNLAKYQKMYKYAYLLSDGVFKIVFTEEKSHSLLISLLNAMLDLHGGDAIGEISLEMQEFPGIFNKKNCIVDIIGTTNAGEKVLVEIQQQKDKFFKDRVEYYVSRVIENQVHKSEKFELPHIYFLGLLDFELFPEEEHEYIHHVDEMCHGKKFFPKIQKVFVEIEKFFKLEKLGFTKDDESDAAQWLRAIRVVIKEEPAPEKIMQNETFRRLLESVKLINFAEELFNCEVKKMTEVMAERENAYAEGKEEGRAVGYAEGASAERTKADQEKRQMAKSLKEQNVDVSIIAKSTGFSEEEILSL